jgi:hypothetical protein
MVYFFFVCPSCQFRVVLFIGFLVLVFSSSITVHCERLVHFPAEPFLRGFLTQWTGGVFIGQHGGDD